MENTNTPNSTNTPATGIQDGKTIAIISYLTIIGWIIAFVMHSSNRTKIGAYHLRQTTGLMIIAICFYVLQTMLLFIPYLGWLINLVFVPLGIGLFVLWIIGLINAINGQEKPIPIIGEKANQLFHGIN